MKLLVVLDCSGVLFGLVTLLFAKTTKLFKEIYQARVQNYKLRAFIGTAIVVLFIIVFSDKKYEGISLWITDNAFNGTSEWRDPVLKLFLTSASLEAGLQGGEVPSLFEIGSSLGSVIGQFVGISTSFIEALGMITVFRCTTNSP